MKQRSFHLFAVFSLLSITSFSFGMQPKQAVIHGRQAYVENRYSDDVCLFKPSELRTMTKYRVEGKEYTYTQIGTLPNYKARFYVFRKTDDDQLLLLRQKDGSFLITHKITDFSKRDWILIQDSESNNNNNNFFGPYVSYDNYDDSNDESDESDDGSNNVPPKRERESLPLSSFLGQYEAFKQEYPGQVRVAWNGVYALVTLGILKKTYGWCFGSKKGASKKVPSRNVR